MLYVSPQGLSRAPQAASMSSQHSSNRAPGTAKMTRGAANMTPRATQAAPGQALKFSFRAVFAANWGKLGLVYTNWSVPDAFWHLGEALEVLNQR